MLTAKSYRHRAVICAALCVGCVFAVFTEPALAGAAPGIKIVGNQFVTTSAGTLGLEQVGANQAVVLRGINIMGPEYSCLHSSVWDSSGLPANTSDYLTVTATGMVSDWHANVVRIPLNEDCWLNVPPNKRPPVGGATYTSAIVNFVNTANANGLIVEVDLHVGNGPNLAVDSTKPGVDSYPAMDTNYSLQFWQSVANTFAKNPSVVFNLTNEPEFMGSGTTAAQDWTCYLTGSYNGTQCNTTMCTNNACAADDGTTTWYVQGVSSVVTAIRTAEVAAGGVSHVIIIAGLNWSNELDDWLTYVPQYVSDTQIAAGAHLYYDMPNCKDSSCWNTVWAPINAKYPLVIDETGELPKKYGGHGCTGIDTATMASWANSQTPEIGYWFWSFNAYSCANGPGLLSSNTTYAPASGYGVEAQSVLKAIQ